MKKFNILFIIIYLFFFQKNVFSAPEAILLVDFDDSKETASLHISFEGTDKPSFTTFLVQPNLEVSSNFKKNVSIFGWIKDDPNIDSTRTLIALNDYNIKSSKKVGFKKANLLIRDKGFHGIFRFIIDINTNNIITGWNYNFVPIKKIIVNEPLWGTIPTNDGINDNWERCIRSENTNQFVYKVKDKKQQIELELHVSSGITGSISDFIKAFTGGDYSIMAITSLIFSISISILGRDNTNYTRYISLIFLLFILLLYTYDYVYHFSDLHSLFKQSITLLSFVLPFFILVIKPDFAVYIKKVTE